MTWKTISLPADMIEDINDYIKRDASYSSASEFVRAAVREHFQRIRLAQTPISIRQLEASADG